MSERFGFSTSWIQHHPEDGPRDYAKEFWFGSFDVAREQHRRACRGGWVTDVMVDAKVGPLRGVAGGKSRLITAGMDLWKDDRPGMSREEFAALWRGWNAKPKVPA